MVLPMEKMQLDKKDPRTELRGGPHLKSSRRETTKERGWLGRWEEKEASVIPWQKRTSVKKETDSGKMQREH